jgi:hypothetical protein
MAQPTFGKMKKRQELLIRSSGVANSCQWLVAVSVEDATIGA